MEDVENPIKNTFCPNVSLEVKKEDDNFEDLVLDSKLYFGNHILKVEETANAGNNLDGELLEQRISEHLSIPVKNENDEMIGESNAFAVSQENIHIKSEDEYSRLEQWGSDNVTSSFDSENKINHDNIKMDIELLVKQDELHIKTEDEEKNRLEQSSSNNFTGPFESENKIKCEHVKMEDEWSIKQEEIHIKIEDVEDSRKSHLDDLSSSDFSTPEKRRLILAEVKETFDKYQRRIRSLQRTVMRLKRKIRSQEALIKYLKGKSLRRNHQSLP